MEYKVYFIVCTIMILCTRNVAPLPVEDAELDIVPLHDSSEKVIRKRNSFYCGSTSCKTDSNCSNGQKCIFNACCDEY
uniref:Uncharacterized protein n=1 Tax=Romanomermis culicivorax TaxID=13658 RepID=A0A915J7Y4_ROMCU